MKKKIAVLCAAAISLGLLASCGSTSVTENTVELKKDGTVVEYTVEDFSESYYDADELTEFVDAQVASYLEDSDATVEVKKNEVEEQTAWVTIEYDSMDTYADFTGTACFSGSVVQAQAAGYDFDVNFVSADEETEEADESSVIEGAVSETSYLSGSEVLEQDDLKVLIVGAAVDVIVPGTVRYVSADTAAIGGKNTVTTTAESDSDVLIYVLYE
ncbi:MAG: hypothetical protein LUD53_05595 [Clostridiales bacterium]|nr:hypothetical protein [Clostridiales bacterium]